MNVMISKHYTLILLLALCSLDGLRAQSTKKMPEQDALITTALYDEKFNSLANTPEEHLAEKLFKLNLQQMVDQGIIHRDDMKGFALPLGVHNQESGDINFKKGMLAMWMEKAKWGVRKKKSFKAEVLLKALHFVDKVEREPTKTTLRDYRAVVLTKAIERVQAIHEARKSDFSADRRRFMEVFMKHFSPNVMLGYNIQEMIPPTHLVDGKIYDINPLFKAYFMDRLLQEGGLEVLEGFPARYDALLSHGPFQMTDLALNGINGNKRLFDEFKVYKSMSDLKTIQDHADAAAMFAYYNWEVLSSSLQASNLLGTFNNYFTNNVQDRLEVKKQRQLKILIAGLTACMHHQPAKSRRMLREVLSSDSVDNLHYRILEMDAANKQLRKYYRSAAEAYLIMKVYHKFDR